MQFKMFSCNGSFCFVSVCSNCALKMASKWDCVTTVAFIQECQARECLWNFKSKLHKNKAMRDAAYKSIANAMNIDGFDVEDVKNKTKNLRSTYAQEMKKIDELILLMNTDLRYTFS